MWPLMIVLLLVNLASAKLLCPDGRLCPEQSTCCKLESGNYDCCLVEKRSQSDDSGDYSPLSMSLKSHSIPVESKILEMEAGARSSNLSSDSSVIYCDYTHYCPDGWKCCRMLNGSWSCCPQRTTVCCHQGTRCCPSDNAGNLSPSSMALKYHSIPMKSKTLETEEKALSTSVSSGSFGISCDDVSICPIGSTCCKSASGGWSCCPQPRAVCCKDGVHCCPHGTKCDIQRLKCIMKSTSIPWLTKTPAQIGSEVPQNSLSNDGPVVYCDDTHVCKAGSTCCKTWHKGWECCPFPKAHCCWDGLHCCPEYHYCDVRKHICHRFFPLYNWIQLSSAKNDEESKKS
ncbi:progranulin-like [Scyliorhinus canicula]|uniref:progranulin-like n=1 Tax=Scyliorhinus canicula TaxID=7830 RepID=UPI0018F7606D|nr:progranulin-like [Scyliorhinus canicula]